jgi:nucleoside recognition membrane protein YjiH
MAEDTDTSSPRDDHVGLAQYLLLALIALSFSGVLYNLPERWAALSAIDFTTLIGDFGKIDGSHSFVGSGGYGARQGFMFAMAICPCVMFAMGVLELAEHYGVSLAAKIVLTPVMRLICGVSGAAGLAIIASLQVTDAGAALTRLAYDRGTVTSRERTALVAWQYAAAAPLANYFVLISPFFHVYTVPIWVPLAVVLLCKCIGAHATRLAVELIERR